MLDLPIFPQTKKLELKDKAAIEKFVAQFQPYSDFNFVSLYVWNILETFEVALLNDNLVIKIDDYITNKPSFSFLGDSKLNSTAEILLEHSEKEGLGPLQLIPATVAHKLDSEKLVVEQDRDNFDYIISMEDLATLVGEKHHPKRRRIKKLMTSGMDVQDFALGKITQHHHKKEEILHVFDKWVRSKLDRGIDMRETENETKALHRLLSAQPALDVELFTVTLNGKMEAFFIGEQLNDEYFMGHFEKADPNIEGLYQYLKHSVALNLHARGIKYMNIEQDLGVEGLRHSKMGMHPVQFLEKYTVRLAK